MRRSAAAHYTAEWAFDYMAQSTGYAEKGASVSACANDEKSSCLMDVAAVGMLPGGIRHYPFAKELIAAGARPAGLQCKPADPGEEENSSLLPKDEDMRMVADTGGAKACMTRAWPMRRTR